MKNYHFTAKRQQWLRDNNHKLRTYMRIYMRERRNGGGSSNIKLTIKNKDTIINFD